MSTADTGRVEAGGSGAGAAPPRADQRLLGIMTALGFASGLPFSLLVGSLGAWLTNAGLSFGAIGALSLIALFYAFKFIWAPAFDWLTPPFANTVGRRRAWMAGCQAVIIACLFGITSIDPRENIALFAAFAAVAAFASASQDIVIDAWRIETASDRAPLDRLSTRYQLGYRLAAIMGGAVALLLADVWKTVADAAAGWPQVFLIMSVAMAVSFLATLAAPEPALRPRAVSTAAADPEASRLRAIAVVPVAIGWAVSGAAILGFMFYSLTAKEGVSAAAFRDAATPWILLVTVGAPLAMSYWLARKPGALEAPAGSQRFSDILFERVLAPLTDIVKRYWLWALPVLLLAMTYRIADSIWGSFANPFYLTILKHSNSDIAVASKMVGVFATLLGIAAGGAALALIGRMPALIVGGVLAAVTNLLYADLARGGAGADAFLAATGLGAVFDAALSSFVGAVKSTGATIFDGVTLGPALSRLTAVIAAENVAGGFASAVHIAWLSSIVNRQYAAVQYALLSSLALLVGVIFRPRIGSYIDAVKDSGLAAQADRFHDVFVFATWIGLAAVALCFVEWWRQSRAAAAQGGAAAANASP
ncbi:MAG: beta-lactamase induction signal transducer [Alphaproteobacteria bacterium]|nr:beta-lactamase induction signal transducer [Alphaproteobacteria bacterium]